MYASGALHSCIAGCTSQVTLHTAFSSLKREGQDRLISGVAALLTDCSPNTYVQNQSRGCGTVF